MANETAVKEEKKAEKKAKNTTHSANDIRPGMTIRVHQSLVEKNAKGEEKKRVQVFEGIVLGRNHGKEAGSTITVRKVSNGVGVEKIFPINSPWIEKFEIVKKAQVRRAKLGYLRNYTKKLREKKVA